jgi:hypothetical protein
MDPQLLLLALKFCAHTYSILYYYQMITGAEVLPMLANNQLSIEAFQFIAYIVNQHMVNAPSVVPLIDVDLWQLLNIVIQESGNTNIIRAEVLQEFGLYTNSVIAYLISFGFRII